MVESSVETKENTEKKSRDLTIKECLYPLPNNCFPLVHQVAGHFYGKGRTKLGTRNGFYNLLNKFAKNF